MFKVVCIEDKWDGDDSPNPILNEIYTVIESISCPCGCSGLAYVLEELDYNYCFVAESFVPLDDYKEADKAVQQLIKEVTEPITIEV